MAVAVAVGEGVAVAVAVGDEVTVGEAVEVAVAVGDGVVVGVRVGIGVAVGLHCPPLQAAAAGATRNGVRPNPATRTITSSGIQSLKLVIIYSLTSRVVASLEA